MHANPLTTILVHLAESTSLHIKFFVWLLQARLASLVSLEGLAQPEALELAVSVSSCPTPIAVIPSQILSTHPRQEIEGRSTFFKSS